MHEWDSPAAGMCRGFDIHIQKDDRLKPVLCLIPVPPVLILALRVGNLARCSSPILSLPAKGGFYRAAQRLDTAPPDQRFKV